MVFKSEKLCCLLGLGRTKEKAAHLSESEIILKTQSTVSQLANGWPHMKQFDVKIFLKIIKKNFFI